MTPLPASEQVKDLLDRVADGEIETQEAARRLRLAPFVDTGGHARIDHERPQRTGEPEVIFSEPKTPAQVADIFAELRAAGTRPIIATRASAAHARAVEGASYEPIARLLIDRPLPTPSTRGTVVVACAGTSDLPVAREASGVLSAFGVRTVELVDIGVAGLHRLLAERDRLQRADVCIIVAGMEGALPSVVAGMVPGPVIAVPTSVGYGTSFEGLAALLGMMSSCAPGISTVNIDNGFGAALVARRMLRINPSEG